MEGALLRLRPKVMTVSTVVAGLLPIMWSTRVGAEVMKPLATPVLGGMVSSLLHVLIVTPVIFYWIHARRLPDDTSAGIDWAPDVHASAEAHPRRVLVAIVVLAVAGAGWWGAWRWTGGPSDTSIEEPASVMHRARSGDFEVLVSTVGGRLTPGRRLFAIQFRSATSGAPVDVGVVRASGSMSMPGMAMSAGIVVERSGPGHYRATGDFAMAGAWRMTVEWNGPAGSGAVLFEGMVQ